MPRNRFGLGQLRHLYQQMLSTKVKDQVEAAKYLLAPGIKELEELHRILDEQEERDEPDKS